MVNKFPSHFLILLLVGFASTLAFSFGVQSAHAATYSYYRAITVTSSTSIASGTQSSFPLLVSSTLATWESSSTAGGAGHIQNLVIAPNGGQEPADLIYSTSTSCSAPLSFETESYTSSTGALVDWVDVPTMAAGKVIYACYGSSAVMTDQSHPTSTWSANYNAVYHLPTPTSTLNVKDSTVNGNNGTNSGATSAPGQFAGGANFSGSAIINAGNFADNLDPFTVSGWFKSSSSYVGTFGTIAAKMTNWGSGTGWGVSLSGVGGFTAQTQNNSGNNYNKWFTSSTYNDGNWHYGVAVFHNSGQSILFYVDGGLQAETLAGGAGSVTSFSTTQGVTIGANGAAGEHFTGNINEVRIYNGTLTPSWIATEYNNQSSPGTFYSMGSEISSNASLSALTVSAGTLSPAFASSTTSYTDVLPPGTISAPTVTATINDPNATDTITQALSPTGSATVLVTAQDGTSTKTYTVSFSIIANLNASAYLGQGSWTGTMVNYPSGSVNANGLGGVNSLAIDLRHHRLFAADIGDNRVLVFPLDNNNNITNDEAATAVLGASDLTHAGTNACTASTFGGFFNLTYDSNNDRLFVSDGNNSRVLVFNVAPGFTNGEAATLELGQPSGGTAFTTCSRGITQNRINEPDDIDYDSINNRLFISDEYNNRVLAFDVLPADIQNGENALFELGQPSGGTAFTTGYTDGYANGIATQSTFGGGTAGEAYDSVNQRLFVDDYFNNRVMAFYVPAGSGTEINGENALFELGQPAGGAAFTSHGPATTQSGIHGPDDATYDVTNNRLFFSDTLNNRIMFFDVPACSGSSCASLNGENATNEIGQSSWTSTTSGNNQYSFTGPESPHSYDPINNRLFSYEFVLGTSNSPIVLQFNMIHITTASLASGAVGTSYNPSSTQSINITSTQGSSQTYSIVAGLGSLPNGLSLNSSTGAITGTPTTVGSSTFTVEADDNFTGTGFFFDRATYTMNISGSAPTLISAATNVTGTIISVTFSKAMNISATPSEFSVNNGSPDAVTAAALESNTSIIDLTVATPIRYGQTVTINYSGTDVTSADTGILASFSGQSVTNDALTTITATAISGVAAPATGATPVTTISGTGYTGTVSWSPTVSSTFVSSTVYTATITLSATTGYTLAGVAASQFTIAGSTGAANSANSGVITGALFPVTASSAKAITAFSFQGLNPTVTATIDGSSITATVPYGTNVTSLVPTFTTTGSLVQVGSTAQVSGTTANDFTNSVTYTVTAADSTQVVYVVTVTPAPPVTVSVTGVGGFLVPPHDQRGSAQASIDLIPPSSSPSGMTISQMQTLLASLESELQTLEAQASKISPSPTPVFTFTRDLQSGMTGNDVKQLQLFLIQENKGPAAEKLKANGVTTNFASLTKAALIEFQKSVGISPASGYFGAITRGWVREHR